MLKIIECPTVKEDDPVSMAIDKIMKHGIGVAVIDNEGKYKGWIDDRNIRMGIKNPKKTKCKSTAIFAPAIDKTKDMKTERVISLFLAGHFKALPVVENGKVVGAITRDNLLYHLVEEDLVPNISINSIMNTPVYTVDEEETFGKVKKTMKELNIHRLIVVSGNKIVGVISTFDFLMFLSKPRDRQSLQLIETVKRPDDLKIKHFVREPPLVVKENETIRNTVIEMSNKSVSYAVVVDKYNYPIGLVGAHDILKLVLGILSPKVRIYISGLKGEDTFYYETIYNEIEKVIKKFSKSFEFTPINVRVKKGKSVYTISLSCEADGIYINIKEEGYTIEEALKDLLSTLETQLRKLHNKYAKNKKSIGSIELLENTEYV